MADELELGTSETDENVGDETSNEETPSESPTDNPSSGSSDDLVNHPNHYNIEGRLECWDEMRGLFGSEAVAIFDALSAYKYHYRKGEKDGNPEEQDEAKIVAYLHHCADVIATSDRTPIAKNCYRKMKEVLAEDEQA